MEKTDLGTLEVIAPTKEGIAAQSFNYTIRGTLVLNGKILEVKAVAATCREAEVIAAAQIADRIDKDYAAGLPVRKPDQYIWHLRGDITDSMAIDGVVSFNLYDIGWHIDWDDEGEVDEIPEYEDFVTEVRKRLEELEKNSHEQGFAADEEVKKWLEEISKTSKHPQWDPPLPYPYPNPPIRLDDSPTGPGITIC